MSHLYLHNNNNTTSQQQKPDVTNLVQTADNFTGIWQSLHMTTHTGSTLQLLTQTDNMASQGIISIKITFPADQTDLITFSLTATATS